MHYGAIFICQLPSCNLSTQHAIYLYGETPLVNLWTLVHSLTLIIQTTANTILIYFTANNHCFHTIRLILCFQQDRWDWQPHYTVGANYFVVLCAGSTLLLTPVVRPANVSGINLQKTLFLLLVDSTLVSYWGKLASVLVKPSTWGLPTHGHISTITCSDLKSWHSGPKWQALSIPSCKNDN